MEKLVLYRQLLQETGTPEYQEFLSLARAVSTRSQHQYMQERPGQFPFLARMRSLLAVIDYRDDWFERVTLVGGTFGKGGVTAALQQLLAQQRPTGAFFSPAVLSWCETICLAPATPVSAAVLVGHYRRLLAEVQSKAALLTHGAPSHFELMLAVALRLCREAGCKEMVLEVGCGGRNDATNAVPHQVAVVTGVGHDHMPLLGNSLLEVATEKAGIIPANGLFVTREQRQQLLQVFLNECRRLHCRAELWPGPRTDQPAADNLSFEQFVGQLLAPGVGPLVSAELLLPGRLDCLALGGGARLVIDGAHNRDKCAALVKQLSAAGQARAVCLLAVKPDKDVGAIIRELDRIAIGYYVVQSTGELGETTAPAAELARKITAATRRPVVVCDSLSTAWEKTRAIAVADGKDLLVTGSLLLAREALGMAVTENLKYL